MAKLKQSTVPVHTIQVNGAELLCYLDHDLHPIVITDKNIYRTLFHLIHAVPALSLAENVPSLAYLVNFYTNGTDYQFIDDISKFQEAYLERVEFEQNTYDYIPTRIIDHGIFDVKLMHPPRVINRELVFYVVQDQTLLPYRVTCTYPIEREKLDTRYQLLPYAL